MPGDKVRNPAWAPGQAHLQELANLLKIFAVLFTDVRSAKVTDPSDDTPERRRRYIRNVIALVEGVTAAMGRIALADAESGNTTFTPGEIAILRGLKYELNDEGGVRPVPSYQKLTRTVRFSFAALAKTYDADFTLVVGGSGWRCLKSTVEVRNRLLHPKKPEDLDLSDQEMKDGATGVDWFNNEVSRLGSQVQGLLDDETEDQEGAEKE